MAAYTFNPYPPRGNDDELDQVALFIDWDNLVISNYADRGSNRPDLEVLVRRAQQYGTVVIARAYAEWNNTSDRLEVYKAGIEPIYAPVFHADRDLSGQTSKGKSLADPVMVTDCIDFLHLLPQVGTYVLVTGDKDMVPVVRLARLRGRRVVIIGPDYVANVLQQVSDEFIPYRYLLAQVIPPDPYAAYYQSYYAATGQVPPGYYPPQVGAGMPPTAPPTQPPNQAAGGRGGRRLTDRRGKQPVPYTPPVQPYARITPPVGAPPNQVPVYPGYYGQPGMAYPQPQPGMYPQPVPGVVPGYPYLPGQPQPQPGLPVSAQPPVATPAPAVAPSVPAAPIVTPAPVVAEAPATPATTAVAANAVAPKITANDFNDVKEIIRQILLQRTNGGRGQMRARDLKEELLRRIPNFSERRYGFSKFKAMLNAAENAGVLQIDQSGHILWVSVPGAPKIQPEDGAVNATAESDLEDETFAEEAPVVEALPAPAPAPAPAPKPDLQAELAAFESKIASRVSAKPAPAPAQRTPVVVEAPAPVEVEPEVETRLETVMEAEPETASEVDDADEEVFEDASAQSAAPVLARPNEERVTSLVEAPMGAHRPTTPAKPAPAPAVAVAPAGRSLARPKLLEQPFYEDVIILIDQLRSRNRWLGYELLLSNVRDYLSKQMPESEAKLQAGAIVSKLLNDGIIKMAVEVHSRGARKMTVKVAHLQDDTPAVRFALENYRNQVAASADVTAVLPTPVVETSTEEESTVALPVETAVEETVVAAPAAVKVDPTDPATSVMTPQTKAVLDAIEKYLRDQAKDAVHLTHQARPSGVIHLPAPHPIEEPAQTPAEVEIDTASAGVASEEFDETTVSRPFKAVDSVAIPVYVSPTHADEKGDEPETEADSFASELVHAEQATGLLEAGADTQASAEVTASEEVAPVATEVEREVVGRAHSTRRQKKDDDENKEKTAVAVVEVEAEAEEEVEAETEEEVEAEGEAEQRKPRRRRRKAVTNENGTSLAQPTERRVQNFYRTRY